METWSAAPSLKKEAAVGFGCNKGTGIMIGHSISISGFLKELIGGTNDVWACLLKAIWLNYYDLWPWADRRVDAPCVSRTTQCANNV